MGNGRWLRGLVALSLLACSSCGATTRHDRVEPEPTGDPERTVESLRFSKLAAGLDRYCGLTLDEGALVCVTDGKLSLERPGPFMDFALHEDLDSYRELCTVDMTGQLACDLSTDVPAGNFHGVALGFFNSCALAEGGKVVCWIPPALGGSPVPEDLGGGFDLSVDMYHACVRFDVVGHFRCFGDPASEAMGELHFMRVSATPTGACGIARDPSLGQGIACGDGMGVSMVLEGAFSSLDTSVNGDGCATDSEGMIRCWGGRQDPSHSEALPQVSVSANMICGLTADGAARCFDG
ncbi:MAG TPA: hypothetical protein VIW29_00580 [Polyangiaceae bacterium]